VNQSEVLPPHDIDAEMALLSAMVAEPNTVIPNIVTRLALDGSDFFRPGHGQLYVAVISLWDAGKFNEFTDVTLINDMLRDMKKSSLMRLLTTVVTSGGSSFGVSGYCDIIIKMARLRSAEEYATNLAQAAQLGDLDRVRELTATFSKDTEEYPARTGRVLNLTPASVGAVKRVRWLWDTTQAGEQPTTQGRIPMDSMTIAAGGPGIGKSQFAIWLTARITRGELPGELFGKPYSVIYATTEDSWSMTIAPRLIAAGADLDRVFRIDVEDSGDSMARLTLPKDLDLLGEACDEYGVGLFVADPLLSMIDDTVNDYRAKEVRAALEPLVQLAEKHRFCILGLAHFTKNGAADPLNRIAGSGAFGQLIRSAIAFSKVEDEDSDKFVLSQVKNNLGRTDIPSFEYTIQSAVVEAEDGDAHVSRFALGPVADTSVTAQMDNGNRSAEDREIARDAMSWLSDYLCDNGGEATRSDVLKHGRAAGFTDRPIERAAKTLKVLKNVTGFGASRQSVWTLPIHT
jgi:hypothetical protein